MSQSLASIWEASASQPFEPAVSKTQHFSVGFTLLLFGLICSSLFGLSTPSRLQDTVGSRG